METRRLRHTLSALLAGACLLTAHALPAATFFVAVDGADDPARDGLSPATAWASLAYACAQAPAGTPAEATVISVGPGLFVAEGGATVKAYTTIEGAGPTQTTVRASDTYPLSGDPFSGRLSYVPSDYLLSAERTAGVNPDGITVRRLRFESPTSRLAYGALYTRDASDLLLEDVVFEDFAWTGANLIATTRATIRRCEFRNCARVWDSEESGGLRTDVLHDSEIVDCRFVTTERSVRPDGPGAFPFDYTGFFHTDVRIHDCDFRGQPKNFDMEFSFDENYGLEIYDNQFDGTLSIPQGAAQADPRIKEPALGVDYSVWVHDNVFTHAYSIEGPRDFLRVSHNFFDVAADVGQGGRIFSQFKDAASTRAKWFHDNVAVDIDLSLILGAQTLDSMFIYNNTFYYRNSTSTDDVNNRRWLMAAFGSTKGWRVENNVFVAHPDQPKEIGGPMDRTNFRNNVLVNVIGSVPPGNTTVAPGLKLAGAQPAPYFEPADAAAAVVDAGAVLPYGASRAYPMPRPFSGAAPDIGAYESSAPVPVTFISVSARATAPTSVAVAWAVSAASLPAEGGHFLVEEARTGDVLAQAPYRTPDAQRGDLSAYEVRLVRPAHSDAPLLLRVRGVDADGSEVLSETVAATAVGGEDVPAINVSESLVRDELRFSLATAGRARLIDGAGVVVWEGELDAGAHAVDVGALPVGMYYLSVSGEVARVVKLGR